MPDLLIELFSEEIPARMQGKAADDLKKMMTDGMVEAGLTYASAAAFSTPRRLCLTVEGLLADSPTVFEERKGPKVGAPDKAIEGFLRGAGLTRDQLEERDTPKGAIYFASIEKPGRPAAAIIADVLEKTIRTFPWPKSMRWGAGSLRWVRPLHSILCVLNDEAGSEVVPLDVDGITSGKTTHGHRFMAPKQITVNSFEDYEAQLKRAFVVLSAGERVDAIWEDAKNQAFANGLEVVEDAGLLREVAGLVEWPVVLMGEIAPDFLGLPPEVLQTSMKEHQKFFSVKNPKSGLIERFITVANRETADNGATILAGNQKVLFARLSDAKFFWENDLRTAKSDMTAWTSALSNVTFHNKLGTQAERIDRIAALARELAPVVGAEPDEAERAARLAKADLSSEMVYEFPELQGLMGRYYAETAGETVAVAAAAEEHYAPLGPSDAVPTAPVSVAVSLADKIDTLTGFWAIDEKPTGSKDPFALRRAALGVIRLVLENDLNLRLSSVLSRADERANAVDLLSFFHDRLKVYLRDQGVRHDVIDACIAMDGNDDLAMLVKRAIALEAFMKTEDGTNLLQGFKRANNILSKEEEKDGVEYSYGADVKFAETDEERALFASLASEGPSIEAALESEDFAAAMTVMAALRAPIDAFFDAVQVNSDNTTVRRNRLNLLSDIRKLVRSVADLTRVEG
ncbi:glycine--tRNA ligase subunit beta [Planktotalea sp.]|uniref:glycine--tRNA ligase subunit beta n=1 Tax=Planktotalea sp. TaxID=2029877 RepID=UPI0025D96AB8|nr:glycine--tRNA ligase subunit beta [Planktotalea sp.]